MARFEELTRLATYKSWSQNSTMSPLTLAKLGFSYTGRGDEVECFQCKTRINGWNEGDNPQLKHRQMAPHCQLLLGNHPDNVPLDRNVSVPEQVAGTVRGQTVIDGANNFDNTLPPQGGLELVLHEALLRAQRNGVGINNTRPAIDRMRPNFGMLQSETERRSTFCGWPRDANADPDALARAGFFYIGPDDRVQCFSCRGIIRDWEPSDVPIDEHRRRIPNCPFARCRGVQNELINNPAVRYHFEPAEIEARMDTPTVRIILDMGYSRDKVKEVIKTRLSTTGDDFPNVKSLLEAFFQRYGDEM